MEFRAKWLVRTPHHTTSGICTHARTHPHIELYFEIHTRSLTVAMIWICGVGDVDVEMAKVYLVECSVLDRVVWLAKRSNDVDGVGGYHCGMSCEKNAIT